MNIEDIRSLIRESMKELKENFGHETNMHASHQGLTEEDPDMQNSNWNDLVTQCTMTPDSDFRNKVFAPAMSSAPPSVWQGILELVSSEPELQKDILNVIANYRNNERR